MIMKQILLKTGILLFCYTLIISNHIDKSKYFKIENYSKQPVKNIMVREERKYFIVPTEKYVPEEKYLDYLSTYPGYLRNNVIANTSEKILPFENKNNVYLTIFFLISVTIIIVSIDINDKSVVNKKVLLLSIPLLFYFIQSFNTSTPIPLTVTNADTESDITIIKSDINDLESNQSDLEGRVSELEY